MRDQTQYAYSVRIIVQVLVETLWFFLPALVANMAPVLIRRLPLGAWPIDGGRTWRGRRLLGDNKTWRGLIAGLTFGSITSLLQGYSLGWGVWLGCGALCGDALKSFFKRQLDIPPGHPWRPWDQIDVVIGVLLFTQWWYPLSLRHIVTAFIVIGFLMYTVSIIGVKAHLKKSI